MNFNINNNNNIHHSNSNKRLNVIGEINIPDNQNDQTIQFSNVNFSNNGNNIDIKNFIMENEIKNTIHSISTSNDLAVINEVT